MDYDQSWQQFTLLLYFILEDQNIPIDELVLSFRTLEIIQSKSYLYNHILSESGLNLFNLLE